MYAMVVYSVWENTNIHDNPYRQICVGTPLFTSIELASHPFIHFQTRLHKGLNCASEIPKKNESKSSKTVKAFHYPINF